MNNNLVRFDEIENGGRFEWKGLKWKKINDNTAIADGYECSNFTASDLEVRRIK